MLQSNLHSRDLLTSLSIKKFRVSFAVNVDCYAGVVARQGYISAGLHIPKPRSDPVKRLVPFQNIGQQCTSSIWQGTKDPQRTSCLRILSDLLRGQKDIPICRSYLEGTREQG